MTTWWLTKRVKPYVVAPKIDTPEKLENDMKFFNDEIDNVLLGKEDKGQLQNQYILFSVSK